MDISVNFGSVPAGTVGYQFFDATGLIGSRVTTGISNPLDGVYYKNAVTAPDGAIGVYWDDGTISASEVFDTADTPSDFVVPDAEPIDSLTLTAACTMAAGAVSIFPAIGALSMTAACTMAAGSPTITRPGPSVIGAAIDDILSMFGCCGAPNDCALAEAVKAVTTGLQQFYLSDRAKGVATNVQRQIYYFSGPLDSDIDGAGARLPDLNVSPGGALYGVTNAYSVQTVMKVVFTFPNNGGAIILRPADVSPGSLSHPAATGTDASLAAWSEDHSEAGTPLFYEVFQYLGIPMIRVTPISDHGEDETLTVYYIPRPAPITAEDRTNGRAFEVQAAYVESWIMPLCRYAALSSGYFDHANAALAASIRERYTETLATLGLADIQQPKT